MTGPDWRSPDRHGEHDLAPCGLSQLGIGNGGRVHVLVFIYPINIENGIPFEE